MLVLSSNFSIKAKDLNELTLIENKNKNYILFVYSLKSSIKVNK
jgi:hypothetical protein